MEEIRAACLNLTSINVLGRDEPHQMALELCDEADAARNDNRRLRIALYDTCRAMRRWGAEEDGIPEAGDPRGIGEAYDAAVLLLGGEPEL